MKLGAAPLTSVDDVLETLGIERSALQDEPDVSEAAQRVLAAVRDAPSAADELIGG